MFLNKTAGYRLFFIGPASCILLISLNFQMSAIRTVIFIGPQGSGKGTQARLLVQKLPDAAYVEAGELLRLVATHQTPFGEQVKALIDRGILLSDDIWRKVILDRLQSLGSEIPVIIDGSPRRVSQAHILIDHLHMLQRNDIHTIYISLSREESIRRLLLRRHCSICKTPAIANGDPHQACVVCGGVLIQRNDETAEGVANRLNFYETETVPVIAYLKERTMFHEINGSMDVDEVSGAIDAALGL